MCVAISVSLGVKCLYEVIICGPHRPRQRASLDEGVVTRKETGKGLCNGGGGAHSPVQELVLQLPRPSLGRALQAPHGWLRPPAGDPLRIRVAGIPAGSQQQQRATAPPSTEAAKPATLLLHPCVHAKQRRSLDAAAGAAPSRRFQPRPHPPLPGLSLRRALRARRHGLICPYRCHCSQREKRLGNPG